MKLYLKSICIKLYIYLVEHNMVSKLVDIDFALDSRERGLLQVVQ
jgi:hypothetical protein